MIPKWCIRLCFLVTHYNHCSCVILYVFCLLALSCSHMNLHFSVNGDIELFYILNNKCSVHFAIAFLKVFFSALFHRCFLPVCHPAINFYMLINRQRTDFDVDKAMETACGGCFVCWFVFTVSFSKSRFQGYRDILLQTTCFYCFIYLKILCLIIIIFPFTISLFAGLNISTTL